MNIPHSTPILHDSTASSLHPERGLKYTTDCFYVSVGQRTNEAREHIPSLMVGRREYGKGRKGKENSREGERKEGVEKGKLM